MDYQKLNQITAPVTTAMSNMVSLLEEINTVLGTLYSAADMTNEFFPYLLEKKDQKQFECIWNVQQYIFTMLP